MSEVILYEGPAPATPPAGVITIYAKVNGRMYWKGDDGIEIAFYPEGAGTGDLNSDGTVPLSINWDMGDWQMRAKQFYADVPTGTAPLVVDSTTLVTNLNADQVDGLDSTDLVKVADTTLVGTGFFLDEDNMVSDDATKVPSQQSVKKYVDDSVIGLFTDKGNYDASTNTPDLDVSPSGILKGDVYVVSVAGVFFTENVEVGDVLRSLQDSPTALAHWARTQANLDAASVKTLYESNADTNALTDARAAKVDALTGYQSSATAITIALGDRWYYTGSGHAATFPGTFARGTFSDTVVLHNGGTGDLTLTPASGDKLIVNGTDLGTDVTYALVPGLMAIAVPNTTDTAWTVVVIGGEIIDPSLYALLAQSNAWTKAQGSAITTLTDAATVNWDASLGNTFKLTLGGNRTMAAPTNVVAGYSYILLLYQGTGGQTLAWNSVFKWASGTAPILSSGASALDVFSFVADASGNLHGVLGIKDSQ